jgi:hypothetical protein
MRFLLFSSVTLLLVGCVSRTHIEELKEDKTLSGTIFGLQHESRATSKKLVWIWEDAFWE